jgi:cytochrome d ubiquinol oxidase subunit II
VLHGDAYSLYPRLVSAPGLIALIGSASAGLLTLALVGRHRYESARYSAALAVAAIIAGWALAQQPVLLPGLTIARAAAPHETLVLVVVAVLAGAAILFPSLALLYGLLLRGRFDPSTEFPPPPPGSGGAVLSASTPGLLARFACGCLIAGTGLLTIADSAEAHAVGVLCLLAFIVLGFGAMQPTEIVSAGGEDR